MHLLIAAASQIGNEVLESNSIIVLNTMGVHFLLQFANLSFWMIDAKHWYWLCIDEHPDVDFNMLYSIVFKFKTEIIFSGKLNSKGSPKI